MIVGIDLGTTNSAVAFWRDGRAQLIPNSLGGVLTPSAVSIDDDGIVLVGMAARERQSTHPGLTATAFKRYMGSRKATQLGSRSFLPEELSALVLAQLKRDAEEFLGEAVTEAVITVPAYFNDKQRSATRRAGELAGLKVERLLNEPTAAALAYGIHQLGDETRFLVFDLGGGTFDVSILEIFEGVIEVRASTGDNRLGGEDFNEALVTAMRARFAKEWGDDATTSPQLHERLRVAAERARRTLTDRNDATMEVVWREKPFAFDVTEEDFEKLVAPLLARLRDPVVRSLRDSDVHAESLREIVLVGGATRMPVVRRIVARMFGRFPATSVNPDEAVALGAAVQAALKMRDSALKEVAVTDVCPYTLGIDTSERLPNGKYRGGIFAPIIERNTVVPASRVRTFSTITDNQKVMTFGIYQGESREVGDNINLGKISIPIPPKPAGEVDVECRFSYDINGLIEVDVHVPATGERRQLVIVDEEGPTGDDLVKRRELLASLKYHPREKDAHRATLARASRCFEDFLGDKREYVATLIAKYEAALDTQDDRTAERARQELTAALDRLEGESYL